MRSESGYNAKLIEQSLRPAYQSIIGVQSSCSNSIALAITAMTNEDAKLAVE